ncbi:hypothetical protein [Streptomyces griseus]|uniref:hypothetical protein n=1 Tax=Streptomyces griseus TaxID=1911 RepID=UPI0033D66F58
MSRPEERLRSERAQFRAMWIVVAGLVAWTGPRLVEAWFADGRVHLGHHRHDVLFDGWPDDRQETYR